MILSKPHMAPWKRPRDPPSYPIDSHMMMITPPRPGRSRKPPSEAAAEAAARVFARQTKADV